MPERGRGCIAPWSRRDERGLVRMILGITALAVFFLVMLVVVVGLTFSVQVSGHSMMPTLHQGDRLEVDLLHRHDIGRFDLVEASEPAYGGTAGGAAIVKRVIGLPGDRIAIQGGAQPVVLIRPAGEQATYRVDNPSWPAQIGANTGSCCSAALTNSDTMHWRTIPAGRYFLMGDNWGGSTDSRVFGPVAESSIRAKLSFRILPRGRFGRIGNEVKLVRTSA